MPKATAAVAALLLLFTLTACGDDAPAAQQDDTARGFAATAETAGPTSSEEPLTASTPSATPEHSDAEFTAYVRGELLPSTGIADASDEQLISAGLEACEQLRAGVDSESIRLVEGEVAAPSGYFMDSAAIIDGARRFYCPETIY